MMSTYHGKRRVLATSTTLIWSLLALLAKPVSCFVTLCGTRQKYVMVTQTTSVLCRHAKTTPTFRRTNSVEITQFILTQGRQNCMQQNVHDTYSSLRRQRERKMLLAELWKKSYAITDSESKRYLPIIDIRFLSPSCYIFSFPLLAMTDIGLYQI